jgi:hypothetical protein
MTVFLGHPLTKAQAFVFIGIHVILAALVLFLPARAVTGPAGRLLRRVRDRRGPAMVEPAPAGGPGRERT